MTAMTKWARVTTALLALQEEDVREPARSAGFKKHVLVRMRKEGYGTQAMKSLELWLNYLDSSVLKSHEVAFALCMEYLTCKGYRPD